MRNASDGAIERRGTQENPLPPSRVGNLPARRRVRLASRGLPANWYDARRAPKTAVSGIWRWLVGDHPGVSLRRDFRVLPVDCQHGQQHSHAGHESRCFQESLDT